MIVFKEELKRFKPSMDVDDIEDAIMKMDLTDMNDIMFQMMEKFASGNTLAPTAAKGNAKLNASANVNANANANVSISREQEGET